jgi:serine phosphatase RsbU (regulator of sigma subunit)/uncharacterized Zn-finger protein
MGIADWLTRKKLAKLAESDPRFAVLAAAGKVVCPYCLKILAVNGQARSTVVEHALSACEKFQDPDQEPEPEATLRHVVSALEFQHRVSRDPVWRVFDKGGTWYCPFCAKPTKVRVTAGKLQLGPFSREVRKHLGTCYPYNQDPNAHYSIDELKAVIARLAKERELIAQVAKKLKARDPLWCQTTPAGAWVCPYCLREHDQTSLASDMLIRFTAPSQIARHLMGTCDVAVAGGAIKGIEHVRRAAGRKAEAAAPRDHTTRRIVQAREEMHQGRQIAEARKAVGRMLTPPPTDIPGYEIACNFKPGVEMGADFYDFIRLKNGAVGVVVADVSGKGVETSLVMGMTRKVLSIHARQFEDPKDVLIRTNEDTFSDLARKIFITCTYGVLDPAAHRFTVARAGHNFTLVYRAATKEVEVVKSNGMSLGLDSGMLFERAIQSVPIQIAERDFIIQYTYGLTEATNAGRAEFGAERLHEAIKKNAKYDVAYLADRVVATVAQFLGEDSKREDMLILALQRTAAAS